jgi:ornithine carbamoyltransferase
MSAILSTFSFSKLRSCDVASDLDLSTAELVSVLSLAREVKRNPSRFASALSGRYLSLLFEKPSLRTRLTFELAIKQLGGDSVTSVGPIGDREPLKDIARNLDRWTNCIVARTFKQTTIEELARWSSVPVINALSDLYHPCQALADMQTIEERFGRTRGLKLAFVGDGNNVAHSLMLCASRLGMDFAIGAPDGYLPDARIVAQARAFAAESGCAVTVTTDPLEAVADSHAVYTDVWTSMGQEDESATRQEVFRPYQLNEALLQHARTEAAVMHCLPAKRGEEITDGAAESPNSVLFEQAENRLHAQKALLLMLVE